MKLCVIYNRAAFYRTAIFLKIDQTYDCDWYFGQADGAIKSMDYSLLNGKVTECERKKLPAGWAWQKGVVGLLGCKKYDIYLMLGQTKDLSTWVFCVLARLFHRKKYIYFWSHGFYGKETWAEHIIKKALFKMPNGGSFLYGNYARDLMIKDGFAPQKLFVIHNSLDHDKQVVIRNKLGITSIYTDYFGNNNPNLIFVGRLTKVKKLHMILEAMAILHDKGCEYNMTFIGDGEIGDELKKMTKELSLVKNVWFYGACYDEQKLGEMIYNADLCIAPGNIGLTAMHCMVFGTPALTHDDFSHQMPEFEAICEGKTGLFFKNNDINSLAESIKYWFEQKSKKREEIREACIKEIDEKWTPEFQIDVIKRNLIH